MIRSIIIFKSQAAWTLIVTQIIMPISFTALMMMMLYLKMKKTKLIEIIIGKMIEVLTLIMKRL